MNERDKKLLKAGYEQGFQNANFMRDNDAQLAGSVEDESERWVEEPIADNGGTVGQYICWEIGD